MADRRELDPYHPLATDPLAAELFWVLSATLGAGDPPRRLLNVDTAAGLVGRGATAPGLARALIALAEAGYLAPVGAWVAESAGWADQVYRVRADAILFIATGLRGIAGRIEPDPHVVASTLVRGLQGARRSSRTTSNRDLIAALVGTPGPVPLSLLCANHHLDRGDAAADVALLRQAGLVLVAGTGSGAGRDPEVEIDPVARGSLAELLNLAPVEAWSAIMRAFRERTLEVWGALAATARYRSAVEIELLNRVTRQMAITPVQERQIMEGLAKQVAEIPAELTESPVAGTTGIAPSPDPEALHRASSLATALLGRALTRTEAARIVSQCGLPIEAGTVGSLMALLTECHAARNAGLGSLGNEGNMVALTPLGFHLGRIVSDLAAVTERRLRSAVPQQVASALGRPHTRQIISLLRRPDIGTAGPGYVELIAAACGVDAGTVLKELRILWRAGLLVRRGGGVLESLKQPPAVPYTTAMLVELGAAYRDRFIAPERAWYVPFHLARAILSDGPPFPGWPLEPDQVEFAVEVESRLAAAISALEPPLAFLESDVLRVLGSRDQREFLHRIASTATGVLIGDAQLEAHRHVLEACGARIAVRGWGWMVSLPSGSMKSLDTLMWVVADRALDQLASVCTPTFMRVARWLEGVRGAESGVPPISPQSYVLTDEVVALLVLEGTGGIMNEPEMPVPGLDDHLALVTGLHERRARVSDISKATRIPAAEVESALEIGVAAGLVNVEAVGETRLYFLAVQCAYARSLVREMVSAVVANRRAHAGIAHSESTGVVAGLSWIADLTTLGETANAQLLAECLRIDIASADMLIANLVRDGLVDVVPRGVVLTPVANGIIALGRELAIRLDVLEPRSPGPGAPGPTLPGG